ncbi:MAG: NAD-dependent epimerase/dehydratase family protein [Flavobacteriales bacterium]|nr:NAD-dependent epimerase/dehydratase family protein [Flavobacteriales bacterium]
MSGKILVVGAAGQIGTELVLKLRDQYGDNNVVASDIKTPGYEVFEGGPYEILDILDLKRLNHIVSKHNITQVYLLAALLSSTAEQNPGFAWNLNMNGLLNLLNMARKNKIEKIFWPSSIAVFGPNSPKEMCPQYTITEPNTVYGISKLAGERWCEYFFEKSDVDVRSIRYPGLIGWKSQPGGGTTDYAVHIFHKALKDRHYTCYLKEDSFLPMMYMDDAIRATIELMEAPKEQIKIRSSYNIAGMSFSPKEIASEIKKRIADFKISFDPDHRQSIADSWPSSIDDSLARQHWLWEAHYDLPKMVDVMLKNLQFN